MNIKSMIASGVAVLTMGAFTLAPVMAHSQESWRSHHRRQEQNEWRNLAIGAGAVGVLGALNHDDTLTFVGGAGALYSIYRYNQDRDSDDRRMRLRAMYFSHPYFYRDGDRFERRHVWRHGQEYYQFVRVGD